MRWAHGVALADALLARAVREPGLARQNAAILQLREACFEAIGPQESEFEPTLTGDGERGSAPAEQGGAGVLLAPAAG